MTEKLQQWVNQQVEEVAHTYRIECREQRKRVIPVCVVVGIMIPLLFGIARGGLTQRVFLIFGIIGVILAFCMTLAILISTTGTKRVTGFRQQYIRQLENNLTEQEQQLFSDELQSGSFQVIPLKCGKSKLLKPKLLFGDPFCVYCDEYGGCKFIKLACLKFVEFEGNLFSHKENQSGDTVVVRFHCNQEAEKSCPEDYYMSMKEAERAYETLQPLFPELKFQITPIPKQ